MCVVSAVTDYYRGRIWPSPRDFEISWDEYKKYLELKKLAEEVDTIHNQPDCAKPEIEEWEKEVEEQARKWREANQ